MEMRRNIIADEACAAFLACAGRARAVVDVVFASHRTTFRFHVVKIARTPLIIGRHAFGTYLIYICCPDVRDTSDDVSR